MTDLSEFEELVFDRKPSHRVEPLEVAVVRPLCEDDIEAIEAGIPLVPVPQKPSLAKIKHSHHELARLVAMGKPLPEISLLTGYQPSYISGLKNGSDFQELVQYYQTQREQIFVDVLERMKGLGIQSLDKLQEMLDNESVSWTKRELMDLAKQMLPAQAPVGSSGPGGANGPGVSINVKFVGAQAPEGALIDVTPASGPDEDLT